MIKLHVKIIVLKYKNEIKYKILFYLYKQMTSFIPRDINDIIFKIQTILNNFCDDEKIKSDWEVSFNNFHNFDNNIKENHWNWSPEYIIHTKWIMLSKLVNHHLMNKPTLKSWEQQIADILTDTYIDDNDVYNKTNSIESYNDMEDYDIECEDEDYKKECREKKAIDKLMERF
jgi:hypothetical protein